MNLCRAAAAGAVALSQKLYAGSTYLPVLYKFDKDLIDPALPICRMEELLIDSSRR